MMREQVYSEESLTQPAKPKLEVEEKNKHSEADSQQ